MGIKLETRDLVLKEMVLEDVDTFEKWELWRIYVADTALRGRGYGMNMNRGINKR